VGVAAIQLAKRAGARVLATTRADDKIERAMAIGADAVVNSDTGDVVGAAREVTGGRGVDLVLDTVGTALWAVSLFSLAPQGRLVSVGNASGDEATIPSLGYVFHFGLSVIGAGPFTAEEFDEVLGLYFGGGFVPVIEATYPLEQADEAHHRLDGGDVFGKLVLVP
jgi:NADPH:quinone reductase-like Zn-dependent oxidoreductase